jgi:type I restriction enzyme R subunit
VPGCDLILRRGVRGVLEESIACHDIRKSGPPPLDLSKLDFEALAGRFGPAEKSKHRNAELEALKAAIRARLERTIRANRTRADFAEKFEALIDSNAGSRIESLFAELLAFSRSLDDEQQRHVREAMSEEELVVFDILTRPAPELTTEERAEVKKVARALLARLNELLVLDWRHKFTARSQRELAIDDALVTGLPRAYTPELYRQKCAAVFEHAYESDPERAGMNAGVA